MQIRILKGSKIDSHAAKIAAFYAAETMIQKSEWENRIKGSHTVAYIDDGFKIFCAARIISDNTAYACITDLYVARTFRLQKYGSTLVSAVTDSLRKSGIQYLYLLFDSADKTFSYFAKKLCFTDEHPVFMKKL